MSDATRTRLSPAFSDLFVPKLVTIWREGYGMAALKADALAGLTVAIVALPLSMAIAIASGAKPEQGLYAAVVGGAIVSALGGSRFQIGGPAGAFIVLVATTIETYGMDGFLAATMMAGVLLLAIGYLRLGIYIKYIPHPVIVGFTAGIATIILASQLREFLGLNLAHEPAALLPKLQALAAELPSFNAAALAVALASLVVILALRRLAPRWRRSAHGSSTCPSTPSPAAMAGFRTGCQRPPYRQFRQRACWSLCPQPSRWPFSAASNRCCRRWWPTA